LDKWREIPEFPGYSVSTDGLVRNDGSGRILVQTETARGVYVGLSRGSEQFKRMVARLVANAFLEFPANPYHRQTFDTPINRDGDRTNNHIDNLLWRPRWFAVKYHQQFDRGWDQGNRVRESMTVIDFDCVLSAAIEYGLLAIEIFTEAMNHRYYGCSDNGVWPTGQHFEIIDNKSRRNRGL
jgi:NUMOD4 motif-containing protein